MSDNGGVGPQRGLLVAGMGGGTGKSVVTVGLVAALVRQGEAVAVFKKGPDYIDAGWLALAAGRPCYNLDPFLMSPQVIRDSFARHRRPHELALLEGNRGLYDGVDPEGSCSSAELARLLALPVLLVVDCTKTTRTVAALILGCLHFDPELRFAGVVLNRLGGDRHQALVRQTVEHYTGLPVLGALPRGRRDFFPQRHLGVTPAAEHRGAAAAVAALAEQAELHLDLAGIVRAAGAVAGGGRPAGEPAEPVAPGVIDVATTAAGPRQEGGGAQAGKAAGEPAAVGRGAGGRRLKIGYLQDAAFQFYYPDNLEALAAAGAELVPLNALRDRQLPPLAALYIGGGFPETSAAALAANHSFREAIRRAAAAGLPIYAECGGLIYLGQAITIAGEEHQLAGVLPVRFGLSRKPQAHGYTELLVERENPFYPVGSVLKGHEFRYSTVESGSPEPAELVFSMRRGTGFSAGRDGLCYRNVLALYTHVHALGTPQWAPALVARAASAGFAQ
ncbi:MAG: cobyrinate a,c-diamide synthase [Desulfurivibrio sp.]|nr:cobyrinate a,c-diamide synthase [Desulfurivibrio sp.]